MRYITNAVPTFRYVVTVNATPYGVFTECSLPVIEWETQEIKEGGQNAYTHRLLGRRKSSTLTLKNGVGTNMMAGWYMQTMAEVYQVPGTVGIDLRRVVTILLLNSYFVPAMTWVIDDCFPTKWTGPQLNSGDNSIAIQTMELSCGEVTVVPGVGTGF